MKPFRGTGSPTSGRLLQFCGGDLWIIQRNGDLASKQKFNRLRDIVSLPAVGVIHMSNEMKIDVALANLDAGKFSFGTVDTIKNHVNKLENELEVVRGLHASAVREIKLQEYAIWRLEAELRKLNAKIYVLLRANMLTEKAYREMTPYVIKMREYFEVFAKFAGAALERSMADLKAGKFPSHMVDAIKDHVSKLEKESEVVRGLLASAIRKRKQQEHSNRRLEDELRKLNAKIHSLLKANMLTEKAVQKMTPYAIKIGKYFEVFKKYVGASLEKTTAYLSTLHKTAA